MSFPIKFVNFSNASSGLAEMANSDSIEFTIYGHSILYWVYYEKIQCFIQTENNNAVCTISNIKSKMFEEILAVLINLGAKIENDR